MSSRRTRASHTAQGAQFALVILTLMNLLNYLDRYLGSQAKDPIKSELNFSDAQTSLPMFGFIVVYMLASPIFGALADRWPRKALIAAGVAFWSLATGAAALTHGFWSFFIARSLVGVGEAAYATLAPAILSDFYRADRRNRVLMIFYLAIPIGAALSYALGGVIAAHYGWRAAFLICGLPGLVAAGLVLLIREPSRGQFDSDAAHKPPRWIEALKRLRGNRTYVLAVAGYAAVTFAGGASSDWYSPFLQRHRGLSMEASGFYVGLAGVVGGLVGTFAGGMLADFLRRWTRQPYFALCGWSMVIATIFAILALRLPGATAAVTMLFITQLFVWAYSGPINAILANCVSSAIRARAFALSIFVIHTFGDAISPSIVGFGSDRIGLQRAIQLVPIAMGLGAAIWLYAWRAIPGEADCSAPPKGRS
ncbi:MAG TPA: MFS transporter [Tepidisphaeraceae bacterium]|jgi:MFS family permease